MSDERFDRLEKMIGQLGSKLEQTESKIDLKFDEFVLKTKFNQIENELDKQINERQAEQTTNDIDLTSIKPEIRQLREEITALTKENKAIRKQIRIIEIDQDTTWEKACNNEKEIYIHKRLSAK